ncbi:MAG: hypothetical protein HUJ31_10895, partial [Pseudomonadales bacterium]|nr:hypothetical protein [Pseudomonadales bacterium]
MDPESVPSADEIYAWIEEVFSWGIRRSGWEADRKAEERALDEFRRLGLENVRAEPVELPWWEPESASLTITADGTGIEIPCFPLPHTAPTERIELPLVMLEEGTECSGHAVLASQPLMRVPATMILNAGAVPDDVNEELVLGISAGGILVDPEGTLAETEQVLPFSPLIQYVM